MRAVSTLTSTPRRRHLIVMAKVPQAGRVKTRLGQEIGMTTAAWWFRHQLRQRIRALRDPRWQLVLAVAPDKEGLLSRAWPQGVSRIRQGQGHLGRRMVQAFLHLPPGPAVLIGADIPGVTRAHIARAFAAMGPADHVLGPASDGGYWLIGCKTTARLSHGALDGVRWSSAHALSDTVERLAPRRTALTDRLDDVDTAQDLQRLSEGALSR